MPGDGSWHERGSVKYLRNVWHDLGLTWRSGGSNLLCQWPWFSCHIFCDKTWVVEHLRFGSVQEQWGLTDVCTDWWPWDWSLKHCGLPGRVGTGVLREREIGTVMALKAQWNLVFRLLVDNGLWVSMTRVNFVCLFGNVGFDFSDASGNHGCQFWIAVVIAFDWNR